MAIGGQVYKGVPVAEVSNHFDFALDTSQVQNNVILSVVDAPKYGGVKLLFAFGALNADGTDVNGNLITHPDGWIQSSLDPNSDLTSQFNLSGSNSWVANVEINIQPSTFFNLFEVADADGIYYSIYLSTSTLYIFVEGNFGGYYSADFSGKTFLTVTYEATTGASKIYLNGASVNFASDAGDANIGINKNLTGGKIILGTRAQLGSGNSRNIYTNGNQYRNPRMYSAPTLPANIDQLIADHYSDLPTEFITSTEW
jgi:hypothetical protein